MEEIKRDEQLLWGAPYIPWGHLGYIWQQSEDIIEVRPFSSGGTIRFMSRQIRYTPSFTEMDKSDDLCNATVDIVPVPMTVTLDDPITYDWYLNCDDYWIAFDTDNYTQWYAITARVSDSVIEIATPILPPTAGSKKWRMKGYPKDELLEIINYFYTYTEEGIVGKPYLTTDSGGNA
jgi:hypothetical protein